MPYTFEGWVEIIYPGDQEPHEDDSWFSLIDLSALLGAADSISEALFGLSRRCTTGEIKIESLAANRGLPPNPSPYVLDELEHIRRHDAQFGVGGYGGFTYATWAEIKRFPVDEKELKESEWHLVFELIKALERSHLQHFSPEQIRIVIWYNW